MAAQSLVGWDYIGDSACGEASKCVCMCRTKEGYCQCGDDHHHQTELEHRKRLVAALDNGQMIKVFVGGGDNPRVFNTYKTLLRSTSVFFEKALNGDWKESKQKKVKLPEEDPIIFDIYNKWLFTNKILIGSKGQTPAEAAHIRHGWCEPDCEAAAESSEVVFNILLECYILGDHLLDSKFKNGIIEKIIDLIDYDCYPIGWISVLPKKVSRESGIVRLFKDAWINFSRGEWIEESLTGSMDVTQAFLMSLTKETLDSRTRPTTYHWGRSGCNCRYYDNHCKLEQVFDEDPTVSELGAEEQTVSDLGGW